MERHIKRIHTSDPESLFFPSHDMNYEISKFKSHNPNYYSSRSTFHNTSNIFSRLPSLLQDRLAYQKNNPPLQHKNPLDARLEILRKAVEFKRLTEELSFTSIRQRYYIPSNECVNQANTSRSFQLPSFEDLEVVGYKGYVCKECLIAHPLAIYRHEYLPAIKPIPTGHTCDNQRMLEIQQLNDNKEAVIADLYTNELPKLMLGVVRKWTKGQTRLTAIEASSPFDGCHEFTISHEKQWAIRAVRDGFTVLTDEELADFMNTVRDSTYAYLKILDDEMNKNSGKLYFMNISRTIR